MICLNFRLNDNITEKAKITAAIAHTGGSMAQAARHHGENPIGQKAEIWVEIML